MKDPYVLIWALLLFTSIAWYGFLVFYVGAKAGKELKALIATLKTVHEAEERAGRE